MPDNQKLNNFHKFLKIISAGLFVGIPMIPLASMAIPTTQQNPCPSIFYEEPYNRLIDRTFPNCPSNVLGQLPLPDQRQTPVATVTPRNDTIDVRLVNQTNTNVTYQVIGDTQKRILPGQSDTTLLALNVPVTVSISRPDGGLLKVETLVPEAGMLELKLDETVDFGKDKNSIVVEEDGSVFLN